MAMSRAKPTQQERLRWPQPAATCCSPRVRTRDFDIRRFIPHDTRSTAKGHLRNLGFSREISEIALNHKLPGIEGIYDVR